MAAPRVEILSLNIDNDQLIKKLAETKRTIDDLQASQKQLTTAGQTSSTQFVTQAAQLKSLQSQYSTQLNVVSQLTNAKKDAVNVADAVNQALAEEAVSVQQATENNKILISVRNQLDSSTKEGAEAIALLNDKINQNTDFIKDNVSAGEQQKMTIGGYTDSIKEALSQINPFNGGLAGFSQRAAEAGGAGNLLTQSFKGMATGIMGMVKAGLAFLATPIGVAIGVLAVAVGAVVGAFKFMTASMNSTEEGSHKLAKVTATITGIFNGLWKLIKPLGEFMGGAFIKAFDVASAAVEKAIGIVSGGLRLLGFDKAADGVDKFAGAMKQGAKDSLELAEAEAKLTKAQRDAERIQLEYQKRAEKLRQLRDDESKTIKERIIANEQLGAVLKQQLKDELSIANQALKVAQLRIAAEGANKENLDAQSEAMIKIADIQERITGQESEQLANLNSLRKEAADRAKEQAEQAAASRQKLLDDAITQNQEEIALFEAQQGFRKKGQAEELAFEQELMNKKLLLLKQELDAKKMSQTAYEAEILTLKNGFAKKQLDATIQNADAELQAYLNKNQTFINGEKFLSEQLLSQELERINRKTELEAAAQTSRLEAGAISQQEYNDAIALIDAQAIRALDDVKKQRKEAEIEQRAIDLQNKKDADLLTFEEDLQIQLDQNAIKRQQELADAEKTGADKSIIIKKYAKADQELTRATEAAKLGLIASSMGQIQGLLKENTVLAKALAISQAIINTYLGATKALAELPPPYGAIQAGITIATGMVQVAKIGGVKFSRGGQLQGASHAQGGIPFTIDGRPGFEAEGGETIINKRSSQMFLPLLSAINQAGGGYAFAGGGNLGNTNLGQLNGQIIDYDILAMKMATANSFLPAPVVAITDINAGQRAVQVVESGANF
jgi:hypothetical protein